MSPNDWHLDRDIDQVLEDFLEVVPAVDKECLFNQVRIVSAVDLATKESWHKQS